VTIEKEKAKVRAYLTVGGWHSTERVYVTCDEYRTACNCSSIVGNITYHVLICESMRPHLLLVNYLPNFIS